MLFAVLALAGLDFTLIRNGYLSDTVLKQISDASVFAHTHDPEITDSILLSIPDLIIRIFAPFMGPLSGLIPTLIALVSIAGTTVLCVKKKNKEQKSALTIPWMGLLATTILFNPVMLWVASTSGSHALGIFIFSWLGLILSKLYREQSMSDYLKFGLLSVFLEFCDPMATVLGISMIPWIVFARPPGETKNPTALMLILMLPMTFAAISIGYLNLTILGQISPLIDSFSHGNETSFPSIHGLTETINQPRTAFIATVLGLAIFFPTIILCFNQVEDKNRRPLAIIIMTLITAPIICLASRIDFKMTSLLGYWIAPLIVLIRNSSVRQYSKLMLYQSASLAISWMIVFSVSITNENIWLNALIHAQGIKPSAARQTARWIEAHMIPTEIDPQTDYQVIGWLNNAKLIRIYKTATGKDSKYEQKRSKIPALPNIKTSAVYHLNTNNSSIWNERRKNDRLEYQNGPYEIWAPDNTSTNKKGVGH